MFVGSKLSCPESELKTLGRVLRKNKVSVDIINFGDDCALDNQILLEQFINEVNNDDNRL